MEAHILAPRINDIFTQVNRLLAMANDEVAPGLQRFGGYLTILDAKDGKVLLVLACGNVPIEKAEKYRHLSMEKALRVFCDADHKTSWDTQDEANAKYPGAIKGREAIYSFSGHQPDVDEAISVSVFYIMEPADNDIRRDSEKTQNLFNYYYQQVAERNSFIQPFVKFTERYHGNFFLRQLVA